MRGSEENGINGISGKHPCGRAYRSAHFEKYLVARKRLEIYSKGFVVTRNDGGPHPCGSAPKPFSLTPRQYLTRKTVCSHPESKAHVLFCPYSSSKSVPNFQCDTKANTHANDRCQFQDFSPTTISDRLTLHKTYSGPCSPLLGKILEDALSSSFAAKFQELHAQAIILCMVYAYVLITRNEGIKQDARLSPTQNYSNLQYRCCKLSVSIRNPVSIPLVAFVKPILIFAIVKMSRARMCEFLRLGMITYLPISKK